jgi:histidinol-phosphate phosphatase family protein
MKAVIVAGGKGTRAYSMTGDIIPKVMMPIAGKPIVFRQLDLLARYGIKEIVVLAGHLAQELEAGMAPYARELGIQLEFFIEATPLGTAGGLLLARDSLAGSDFLVLYGDMAIEMDLARLLDYHHKMGSAATIVAHPNDHPHESDLLQVNGRGHVFGILHRKNRTPGAYRNLVPAATYCFTQDVFRHIHPSTKQDFIKNVLPEMIDRGTAVYAYNTPEYLRDTGSPERYAMVERDIRSGLVGTMNYSVARPAVFFDRDGVLNPDVEDGKGLTHQDQMTLLPGAARAVKLINERGWLAVVVTNQPGLAKGFVSYQALAEVHAKLETLLGYEGAKLDRIYYCPHHPERGFEGEVLALKIECECRKPKGGMLAQAMKELPILHERSCLIGDSWRDAGAARESGIPIYGVRTGAGCKDCSGDYQPDQIFQDVFEASRFALERM